MSTGLSSSIGIIFSVVDLCPYLIFLSLLGPIGAPATLANVILCNHPLGGSLIFIVSIPFSLDTSYREAQLSSINMHWYVIPPPLLTRQIKMEYLSFTVKSSVVVGNRLVPAVIPPCRVVLFYVVIGSHTI